MPSNDQRKGDWILLPSGAEFCVLDPRAEEIHISDIAHNLANNCRFHGSCRKYYSVTEHSVYAAYLLRHEPMVTQLLALLHDATEAYLPDLAPQVKIAIPQFQILKEGLWKAICHRFEIPYGKAVYHQGGFYPKTWIPTLDRNTQMLEEHFPHIIDEARKLKIRVLSPAKAKSKFLHSFYQLLRRFERCGASAGQ